MDDIAKVLLGALLSIAGGFLSEEVKKRRKLWATSRSLLYELQRLWESTEHISPEESLAMASLKTTLDEYKQALFVVDRSKFEEHWGIYRDLMRILDSDRSPSHKQTLLVLDIRRRLAALLGIEQQGSAELLGVPETGSPVRSGLTDAALEARRPQQASPVAPAYPESLSRVPVQAVVSHRGAYPGPQLAGASCYVSHSFRGIVYRRLKGQWLMQILTNRKEGRPTPALHRTATALCALAAR